MVKIIEILSVILWTSDLLMLGKLIIALIPVGTLSFLLSCKTLLSFFEKVWDEGWNITWRRGSDKGLKSWK